MNKTVFFIILFLSSYSFSVQSTEPQEVRFNSYRFGDDGAKIQITTNLDLGNPEDNPEKRSVITVTEQQKHFVFMPGRADHSLKLQHFMKRIVQEGHTAWCIDPYGQGGSDGGVPCELFDSNSKTPCCKRKGHGTWYNYTQVYLNGLKEIHTRMQVGTERGNKVSPAKLILVAHSMSACVDMWARQSDEDTKNSLLRYVNEIHYVAPMVSHTLFLKENLGEFGEELVRNILYVGAWVSDLFGNGEGDFIGGGGSLNPHELTDKAVSDKVHDSKCSAFIKVCQQKPEYEIGRITNQWFCEADKACREIKEINPAHFGICSITVHVPENDVVVYPEWVRWFFDTYLPEKAKFFYYADEPHNLFWGSDQGVNKLLTNIL